MGWLFHGPVDMSPRRRRCAGPGSARTVATDFNASDGDARPKESVAPAEIVPIVILEQSTSGVFDLNGAPSSTAELIEHPSTLSTKAESEPRRHVAPHGCGTQALVSIAIPRLVVEEFNALIVAASTGYDDPSGLLHLGNVSFPKA